MNTLKSILWCISYLIFLIVGVLLLIIAAHLYGALDLTAQLDSLRNLPNLWIILGFTGALIVVISFSIVRVTIGTLQREKTIAFENPEGQVVISLSAIEDFIKRIVKQIVEMKDMRCSVVASKKGIRISTKVALWSDANIPDATDRIQSLIRSRVQEMLGIEESITVAVHITKIVHKDQAPRKEQKAAPAQKDVLEKEPTAGFKGTIEYKSRS